MKFRFEVQVKDLETTDTWTNTYEHEFFTWDGAVAEAQGQVAGLNKHDQGYLVVYTLVSIQVL